jgi:uncharacterized protein
MPVLDGSSYRAPIFLCNGHLLTVYPNLARRVFDVRYQRRRIPTPDGDFLDLDQSSIGSDRVVIIAHGLEGNSSRPYILGMVRAFNRGGWDAVAWNFRGCSGEPNRTLRFYHSGDTPDLHTVLSHVMALEAYRCISLVGFSLGGNIVLKYLGEQRESIAPEVCAAVAFSVPCDLRSGAQKMALPVNAFYMRRFLSMLHEKVRAKMELFPGRLDDEGFARMTTFKEFDERYTAALHGFADAEDYWRKASSKPLLKDIRIPTLLVNARDDPFLAALCYPREEARQNPCLFLETPVHGGHVGFVSFSTRGEYWSEARAREFIADFA